MTSRSDTASRQSSYRFTTTMRRLDGSATRKTARLRRLTSAAGAGGFGPGFGLGFGLSLSAGLGAGLGSGFGLSLGWGLGLALVLRRFPNGASHHLSRLPLPPGRRPAAAPPGRRRAVAGPSPGAAPFRTERPPPTAARFPQAARFRTDRSPPTAARSRTRRSPPAGGRPVPGQAIRPRPHPSAPPGAGRFPLVRIKDRCKIRLRRLADVKVHALGKTQADAALMRHAEQIFPRRALLGVVLSYRVDAPQADDFAALHDGQRHQKRRRAGKTPAELGHQLVFRKRHAAGNVLEPLLHVDRAFQFAHKVDVLGEGAPARLVPRQLLAQVRRRMNFEPAVDPGVLEPAAG